MKLLPIFFILSFSLTVFSQDYDFGKVSKEELEEKFDPLDSSASAVYLYKNRKTFFEYKQEEGFVLITEIQDRIKIYNKEGFEYATKEVGLYKYKSDEEKISGLKAYTYNLINEKVEDTKLDKKDVFKNEQSKYKNVAKFTMPNLKEGSVIEYKYRIESPFYWNVEDFEFQYEIPVKKLEAKFEAPEYFIFKPNVKGFLAIMPKNETERDKITFRSKTRKTSGSYVSSTSFNSSDLEFVKNISSFDLSDVPALKEEPYVNNINNYRSAIQYELSYTKFPQSTIKYYSTTWEDVVKTIYQSSSFDNELDKTGYFEDDIDALIGKISNPMERASLIFNFVKNRVKWNGYYGKYTDEGVRKAYVSQVGNVAEINLMLTGMLRYAGLNANPVLVSTRQNGIPLFPTLDGYNYVISGIETDNGVILLDATNKYSTPNVLPFRALNWEGRIIRKDKSSTTISLYPNKISKNVVTMAVDLSDNGDLDGNVRFVKTGHNAMGFREDYLETDKDQFLESLENKYGGMEIDEFQVENEGDLSKPIMESYKFIKESQADIIDDKIYFSPLFFLRTKENPFKLEKREFPVDFGYPSSSTYRITVNLPEGYKIESMPEVVMLSLPDSLGSFKYIISGQGTSVQLMVEYKINQPIITSLYYDTLKEFFNQMITKESEQVVLTKI